MCLLIMRVRSSDRTEWGQLLSAPYNSTVTLRVWGLGSSKVYFLTWLEIGTGSQLGAPVALLGLLHVDSPCGLVCGTSQHGG